MERIASRASYFGKEGSVFREMRDDRIRRRSADPRVFALVRTKAHADE